MKKIIIFIIVTTILLLLLMLTQKAHANLIREINQQRINAGVAPLTENVLLDKSAKIKACDMYNNHYFAHLDLNGKMSWELIALQGYNYLGAGETMARNFGDDDFGIARAWYTSPSHRKTMLNTFFKDIGIGKCGNIAVAHYGKQKSWFIW